MLWQCLHILPTLQQGLVWMLPLRRSSALWAANFQLWLQGNGRERRKGVGEINGLYLIPSSPSCRSKGQWQMNTVKLLSARGTVFSWGEADQLALCFPTPTLLCVCMWDRWVRRMRLGWSFSAFLLSSEGKGNQAGRVQCILIHSDSFTFCYCRRLFFPSYHDFLLFFLFV